MSSGHDSAEIGDKLLSYLHSELNNPNITFSSTPTDLVGGFDTFIYKFRLRGAPRDLSSPLVLRIFGRDSSLDRALFESVVQNALASSGYPAPRVFFTCSDAGIFGASFMIMEFKPGHTMMEEPVNTIPEMLAKAHLHLHYIDTKPIRGAIESAGMEPRYISFKRRFSWLKERIESRCHKCLFQGLNWLEENLPEETEKPAAVHGDFHPLNILVDNGEVSGVLDWSGFLLAEPAYDVAITRVIGMVAAPAIFPRSEWSRLIDRYYTRYRKEIPVDPMRVGYYEAFRCLWALYEGVEGHQAWSRPEVRMRLIEHFKDITGILIPRSNTDSRTLCPRRTSSRGRW